MFPFSLFAKISEMIVGVRWQVGGDQYPRHYQKLTNMSLRLQLFISALKFPLVNKGFGGVGVGVGNYRLFRNFCPF